MNTQKHTHVHMQVSTHTHTNTHKHARTHKYKHTHTIQAHTHTWAHTHTKDYEIIALLTQHLSRVQHYLPVILYYLLQVLLHQLVHEKRR